MSPDGDGGSVARDTVVCRDSAVRPVGGTAGGQDSRWAGEPVGRTAGGRDSRWTGEPVRSVSGCHFFEKRGHRARTGLIERIMTLSPVSRQPNKASGFPASRGSGSHERIFATLHETLRTRA